MTFDTDHRTELLGEEEDQRREEAERALHEPHDDDRGFHLSPDGREGHARSVCRCDGRCFDEDAA